MAPLSFSLQTTIADDLEQFVRRPSSASVELVERLAADRGPEAGQALIDHYGELSSLGSRLAALQGLAQLGGDAERGEAALAVVRQAAVDGRDSEEREGALLALAAGGAAGRKVLAELIEAPVADTVRERALELHVAGASPADDAFYRRLWRGERLTSAAEVNPSKRSRKLSREELEGQPKRERLLPAIVRKAFVAVADRLSEEDLISALGHQSATVRHHALRVLLERGHERRLEWAQAVFEDRRAAADTRALAAEALLEADAEEWIEQVVEEGGDRYALPSLRRAFADLVVRFGDEEVLEDLEKVLTRGSDEELMFRVLALAGHREDRYQRKLEKLVRHKKPDVRRVAIEVLGRRGDAGAAQALEKAFDDAEDPAEATDILRALSTLRGADAAWDASLLELAGDERGALRNAALAIAAERKVDGIAPLLARAAEHPDWSTRSVALVALAQRGDAQALGILVARVEHEDGRLRDQLVDALWRLTGKAFGENARAWQGWWSNEAGQGANFKPISAAELRRLEAERERRRLEANTTSPEFFGVRVVSTSVTFVLDASGSMEEPTRTPYEGVPGPQRFGVATAELKRTLERLEPRARFNVLAFSTDVFPWSEELREGTPEAKAEALEFVDGLRANGGTNLFGALETAFADPEMDTLVILSDGEPSMGEITNSELLRKTVADWNRDRGVRIHTVQLGAELPILEWLSEDSGGSSTRIP